MREVGVQRLIDRVTAQVTPVAETAGVRLVLGVQEGLHVVADTDQVVQAVTDLVATGIGASPANSTVLLCAAKDGTDKLCISVLDRSTGGDETWQPDASTQPATRVRNIVRQHDGRIDEEQTEGVGGCYLVTLPRCRQEGDRPHLAEPGGRTSEAPSVLIVDDDAGLRRVIGGHLGTIGAACAEAQDGVEAFDAIHSSRPDLVILDVGMPRMDGFALVEALRTRYPDVPVLVYTGRDLTAAERQQLELGSTKYLIKARASEEAVVRAARELLDAATQARAEVGTTP